MFAIFESGSKQHLVKEGALVKVEKLGQDDKEIVLDRILMVSSDEKKWVGTPYVEKARIIAENLGDRRDKKVLVFKRKAKKGFKKLIGRYEVQNEDLRIALLGRREWAVVWVDGPSASEPCTYQALSCDSPGPVRPYVTQAERISARV